MEKKVHEKLRAKTEDEIKEDLKKLKEELKDLRNNKAANANSAKAARIKIIRKSIARHFTLINEKARKRIGEKLAKTSPKLAQTLRSKLTRAVRRRLTKQQRDTRLVKVQKRLSHFPLRKFGLKA